MRFTQDVGRLNDIFHTEDLRYNTFPKKQNKMGASYLRNINHWLRYTKPGGM